MRSLDAEGRLELERRLGAWQRRRVLVFFAIAATLLALSTSLGSFAWPSPDPERPDDPVWRLDNHAVGDATLTAILLTGLFVSLPRHRTHRQVVGTIQVTLVAMTVVIVAAAPFAAAPELASAGASTQAIAATVTIAGAAGIFILHLSASAIVALSPREALRPLVPMALVFALVTLVVVPVPWSQRIGLATLGALAGVPGLLWSVARYRRFEERFVAAFLGQRVDALDRDLDHARRLHESLLPTPIREGPVRVDSRYAPMSAIGGDFLTLRRPQSRDSGRGGGRDGGDRDRIPDDDLVGLVVDVTGHGIAAALAVNPSARGDRPRARRRPRRRPGGDPLCPQSLRLRSAGLAGNLRDGRVRSRRVRERASALGERGASARPACLAFSAALRLCVQTRTAQNP